MDQLFTVFTGMRSKSSQMKARDASFMETRADESSHIDLNSSLKDSEMLKGYVYYPEDWMSSGNDYKTHRNHICQSKTLNCAWSPGEYYNK